jgi:hypothetical protein
MLNLIELHKEVYALEVIQVFKGGLNRKSKPLCKCPDAGIYIWNLILATHK